ncbi:MAG: heparinase II/III family protein [Thiotrichales bacterium]
MIRATYLFHTVRHLKPVQIYWRLWLKLYTPSVTSFSLPLREPSQNTWVHIPMRAPSMLKLNRFTFLNESGELTGRASWNDPKKEKLWLYNLHYFDDLNAEGADERSDWHRALVQRWIDENPVGAGNGWEPYPLSLRIVNWVKWGLQGHRLESDWQVSLATQARYLRRRLEYHLLGNHLFANAKALVFAGLFFAGDEADEWLEKGLAILARELAEQVLPDGGHFELSPMYHAIILEDLLDLLNLARVYGTAEEAIPAPLPVADWRAVSIRMLRWYQSMSHPDGALSFFNDATLGVAPRLADLQAYFAVLVGEPDANSTRPVIELPDSGYIRVERGQSVALLDVGRIGPDYLPGHAHADSLSFELSYREQRVIVNGGISRYGGGAERLRQRGTRAHSTVVVDHEDSSEVWGGFRVARRARPFGLEVENKPDETRVTCAHDGYRRLPGHPVHRRTWLVRSSGVEVRDRIEGGFTQAEAIFHIHPDVEVQLSSDGQSGRLLTKEGEIATWSVLAGVVSLEEGSYHPGFGLHQPSQVIRVAIRESASAFRLQWL